MYSQIDNFIHDSLSCVKYEQISWAWEGRHRLRRKKTLEEDVPLPKTTLSKSCSCSNSSWSNNTEKGPCWGTERQWDASKVSSRAHNCNIIFLITPSPTLQIILSREMLSFHLSLSQCFKIIHLNMGSTPEYCCSSK